jgi:DNA-binding transcriptional regulator LsrR (DeoR family)
LEIEDDLKFLFSLVDAVVVPTPREKIGNADKDSTLIEAGLLSSKEIKKLRVKGGCCYALIENT